MNISVKLDRCEAESLAGEILDQEDTKNHDFAVWMLRAANMAGSVIVDAEELWNALGREP